MKIKIRITTPKGQAKKTEKRIRKFILGFKSPHTTYANKDDSQFFWEVDCEIKKAMKIIRNVTFFETMIEKIFTHKRFKKHALKRITKEEAKQLESMLKDQTKVEVVEKQF